MMKHINRRDFLKGAAAAAAVTPFMNVGSAFGQDAAEKPVVYVIHGKDVSKMLAEGVSKLGGWEKIVKKGEKATIKPNAAWASTPEQGGNTDPALVGACVAACLAAGASEVVVPENPCSPPEQAFGGSGIKVAVEKAGGRMYKPGKDDYEKAAFPQAKELKEALVVKDVLHTGCLINMPVAKSHEGSMLTLSMKNWMGAVDDRGFWHRHNLHQCIADCSTLLKPTVVILDATRIMLTKGPRGPGKLDHPEQIVLGQDPVAVDAYAATLFKKKPFDIQHIKMAHDMKIGCGDLEKVEVVHVNL